MKAFFGLIIGLAIPILLVAFTFRLKGLNQQYQPHVHPMNQKSLLYIAHQAGSGEHPANTWEAIDYTLGLNPKFTIWLDIHQTRDEQLVIYGPDMLEAQTEGSGHIGLQMWEDVKKLNAGFKVKGFGDRLYEIRTLEETLKRYPDTNFVFNIRANATKIDLRLAALFKKYNVMKRAILTSPFEIVTKTLRKEEPLGMYAMSLSEFTRLNMFASLYLAPAIPIKGDIFLTPRKLYQKSLSPELVAEIHRRKKKVIVSVETLEDWQKWSGTEVDGIITKYPSRFVDLIAP